MNKAEIEKYYFDLEHRLREATAAEPPEGADAHRTLKIYATSMLADMAARCDFDVDLFAQMASLFSEYFAVGAAKVIRRMEAGERFTEEEKRGRCNG